MSEQFTLKKIKNMKNMKNYAFALVAMVIALGSFSLMSFKKSEVQTSYFYEYTSSSTSQLDIENINNYQRSEQSCEPGDHVCGVNLPSNTGLGNPPNTAEFDAVKSQLWASEQSGEAQTDQIQMKD